MVGLDSPASCCPSESLLTPLVSVDSEAPDEPRETVQILTPDPVLHRDLLEHLSEFGIPITSADSLTLRHRKSREAQTSILILDIRERLKDAFTSTQLVRALRQSACLVVLGPDNAIDTEREAFELGAEEFIGRPFELARVALRVKVLYQRVCNSVQSRRVTGSLVIDKLSRSVWVDARRVQLTPSQYRLLDHLTCRLDHPVSFQELAVVLGNTGPQNLHLRVRQAMHQLALRLGSAQALLVNVRGYGYRLLRRQPASSRDLEQKDAVNG